MSDPVPPAWEDDAAENRRPPTPVYEPDDQEARIEAIAAQRDAALARLHAARARFDAIIRLTDDPAVRRVAQDGYEEITDEL